MEFYNNLPILDIQEDWKNKNLYIHCHISNGFVPNNGLILMKPFVNTHKYSYFVCNQLEIKNHCINMLGYNGPNILENLFPKMYQYELDNGEKNVDFDKMYKSKAYKKVYQQIYKHKKHKQFLLLSVKHYGNYLHNKYMKDLIENRDLYNLSIMIIDKDKIFMKNQLDYVLYINLRSYYSIREIYDNFYIHKNGIKDIKDNFEYHSIHNDFYSNCNKEMNTYFIYKKNNQNQLYDLYKYEVCEKEIEELTKEVKNNTFYLCKEGVWEHNKYIIIKNNCLKELLFLANYKKIFKKFDFKIFNDKKHYKNIFIGQNIHKNVYDPFHKIINELENIYTYEEYNQDSENGKLIKHIYHSRPREEDNEKKVLPTYALCFKNIHTFTNLLKKSYFEEVFHANQSYKTHFYIYEDTLTKDFFTKKIDLDDYSKCMGYMNVYDDNPLYYSNIDYIIIDIRYIKEHMKFMYDELLYSFIPEYKSYEKLIHYYSKKYNTMIINYIDFNKDTYDYHKSINKVIYFF